MRWGVCDVGDVRCGGCAMRVDLCVGWLGWLISGFRQSRRRSRWINYPVFFKKLIYASGVNLQIKLTHLSEVDEIPLPKGG